METATVQSELQSHRQPLGLLSGAKNYLKNTIDNAKHDYALAITLGQVYKGDLMGYSKAVWANYKEAGAFQGNGIANLAIGMFVFAMVIVACYMGISYIEPIVLTGNATADADVEKAFDMIRAGLGIMCIVVIFIALGALIAVISGWGSGR